jgi:hypothetical protein
MMAPYATGSLTPSPYVYGPPQMYSLPSPSVPGPSTAPTQPTWDQAAFINAMNNFTLNNPCDQSMTFSAHYFSKLLFHRVFGLKLFALLLFFSIFGLQKHVLYIHRFQSLFLSHPDYLA